MWFSKHFYSNYLKNRWKMREPQAFIIPITIMWHYAKTPWSINGFLKIILCYFFENIWLSKHFYSNYLKIIWKIRASHAFIKPITIIWHHAKTPRSTSGFLEKNVGTYFGKYVIVQFWEDLLGGMETLHYGYVALCKNTEY